MPTTLSGLLKQGFTGDMAPVYFSDAEIAARRLASFEPSIAGPTNPAAWTGPITITDAAWRNSSSVPIQLVAAAGANTLIVPHRSLFHVNLVTAYGVSRTTSLVWSGDTATAALAIGTPTMDTTGSRVTVSEAPLNLTNLVLPTYTNSPLMFFTSANTTGGVITNSLRVWVLYSVVDLT